ncbi:MAG TPA: nucleotidyltransferase domain-containing protein [Anaerolineae bacterium]
MLTKTQLDQVLQEVVAILHTHYEPDEVILFGSYAYGRPHRDSDLDLFIVKDSPARPVDRQIFVRRLLRKINYQLPLTIIVMTPDETKQRMAIGDQFINEVLTKGKVLYARNRITHPA